MVVEWEEAETTLLDRRLPRPGSTPLGRIVLLLNSLRDRSEETPGSSCPTGALHPHSSPGLLVQLMRIARKGTRAQ